MPIETADELFAALGRNQLLSPDQLLQVERDLRPQCSGADALASELVRREWLTAYTADMLLGRVRGPSIEIMNRLPDVTESPRPNPVLSYRGIIARRLGTFVVVSLLIGLGLHLLLAVPPGWSVFWGFALYRVAWNPYDLIEHTVTGCGCAFVFLTGATAFVLNWFLGPFTKAIDRGTFAGLVVVLAYFGPIAAAAMYKDHLLQRRRRAIPALPIGEAKAQVERLMANPRICRFERAPAGEEAPTAELGPLLRTLFASYARFEFLYPSGHVPDNLRFDRRAVRPSIYLVGYVQLNHFDWISCETAVKPREDIVYEIDSQRVAWHGKMHREREAPEITKTYPSIYHFILSQLVYSGHPLVAQTTADLVPDS
jgi:hypothetical protein